MNKSSIYDYIEIITKVAPANVTEVVLNDENMVEIPISVSILELSPKATFIAERYIKDYIIHNWRLCQNKEGRKEYKTNFKEAKKKSKRLAGAETERINTLINRYIKGHITDEERNLANSIKTAPIDIERANAAGKSESEVRAEFVKSANRMLYQTKRSKERYCRNAIFLLYQLYYDEVQKHKEIIEAMKDNNCANILDYYGALRDCRITMKKLERITITLRQGTFEIKIAGRNNRDNRTLPIPRESDSLCRNLYFNVPTDGGCHSYIACDEQFQIWESLINAFLGDSLQNEVKGTLRGKNNFQMRLYKRLDAFYRFLINCKDFKLDTKGDIAEFLRALFELDEDLDEAEKMQAYLGQTKPQKAKFVINYDTYQQLVKH